MKMNNHVQHITRIAVTAALYAVLTILLAPISYGPYQLRVSEALTLLPILTVDAVPGLFIGCLLANLLGGATWFDVVFGSLATLIAALITRKLAKRPVLAALPPVISNGLIVGAVVYFAYEFVPESGVIIPQMLFTMFTVAAGEAVACYVMGLPLLAALKKLPEHIFKR